MDDGDPLLHLPAEEFRPPPGLCGDELLAWMTSQAYDHVNLHAIAIRALDDAGEAQEPPASHVLDHLARANELGEEEEIMASAGANTVVVVPGLPKCDMCQRVARYDAALGRDGETYGAFLCVRCYSERGSLTLGASGDSYLMTKSEVPPEVQEICNRLCEDLGRAPLF